MYIICNISIYKYNVYDCTVRHAWFCERRSRNATAPACFARPQYPRTESEAPGPHPRLHMCIVMDGVSMCFPACTKCSDAHPGEAWLWLRNSRAKQAQQGLVAFIDTSLHQMGNGMSRFPTFARPDPELAFNGKGDTTSESAYTIRSRKNHQRHLTV